VTPISTATDTTLTPIAVGSGPIVITITPNGGTAYVLSLGAHSVTPIRTATNTPLAPIPLSGDVGTMAINPNGKTLYVTTSNPMFEVPGHVVPIRTATNTALKPIKVGGHPDRPRGHPERQDRLRGELRL
jgi:DNA-binding beta-propeller fold protein YncE